jgi:JAB1/Mov34/MPN/PAD-1 ubiquitin protease
MGASNLLVALQRLAVALVFNGLSHAVLEGLQPHYHGAIQLVCDARRAPCLTFGSDCRGDIPQAKDSRLRAVQLEGHVILKLVKHCQECAPNLVTGQLLGLDVGSTLEVTDSFPFPVSATAIPSECHCHPA